MESITAQKPLEFVVSTTIHRDRSAHTMLIVAFVLMILAVATIAPIKHLWNIKPIVAQGLIAIPAVLLITVIALALIAKNKVDHRKAVDHLIESLNYEYTLNDKHNLSEEEIALIHLIQWPIDYTIVNQEDTIRTAHYEQVSPLSDVKFNGIVEHDPSLKRNALLLALWHQMWKTCNYQNIILLPSNSPSFSNKKIELSKQKFVITTLPVHKEEGVIESTDEKEVDLSFIDQIKILYAFTHNLEFSIDLKDKIAS